MEIPDLKDVTPVSERPAHPSVPDVFETVGGERVESADGRTRRRPRLLHLLRQYVYGYAPPAPAVSFEVRRETDPVLGGAPAG